MATKLSASTRARIIEAVELSMDTYDVVNAVMAGESGDLSAEMAKVGRFFDGCTDEELFAIWGVGGSIEAAGIALQDRPDSPVRTQYLQAAAMVEAAGL